MVKNIVPKLPSPADHNKNRNDPNRFFGDGVTFKAKLIGILEVGEARGDRMCQEALQDLKMAIRAAGEHKQRITIHVTIDGLRLRDEKTGDCLYHHPVHKISFIAQDMTDSRAFGYIFGSPDSGHRFFGIKTDKAASQVVLAMRDLFQVVFELKKKEIELAKQHIQSKTIHENQPLSLSIKNTGNNDLSSSLSIIKAISSSEGAKSNHKESPESVADLVDLEQELSSLQRGITQMERITPSEPTATSKIVAEEDPFGDSFTNFPPYNLLPPPESTRSRQSKPNKPAETTPSISTLLSSSSKKSTILNTTSMNTTQSSDNWLSDLEQNDVFETTATSLVASKTHETSAHFTPNTSSIEILTASSTPVTTQNSGAEYLGNSKTNHKNITSIPKKLASYNSTTCTSTNNYLDNITTNNSSAQTATITHSQYIDAFTDLDPLGTGKFKPYVDKKYFFHELKNPPKKVLKDLSGGGNISGTGTDSNFPASFYATEGTGNDLTDLFDVATDPTYESRKPNKIAIQTDLKSSDFGSQFNSLENKSSVNNQGTSQKNAEKDTNIACQRNDGSGSDETVIMMARDTDPFSPTRKKSDPFQDGDIFSNLDPFEFEFSASKTNAAKENKNVSVSADDSTPIKTRKESSLSSSPNVFNGPLQVSLPPESWPGSSSIQSGVRRIERQTSESPTSMGIRNRPSVFKQNTVDVISSISSKKMPHLFGQKFSKRDSNSINMRRLQESDSLSENETAPEPPPRPDSVNHSEPPPLPPKKQFSDIVIRPRITSSSALPPAIRYDYVAAKMKASQHTNTELSGSAPPIPLPLRKVGRSDASYPGPSRPRKPGNDEDDYLAPVASQRTDVPPLLPPPQTKGRGRRHETYDNKTELVEQSITSKDDNVEDEPESIIADITLTQLLTLGIDELATKLNVQTSKLSTMTLVELTTYLSEFIEKSKKQKKISSTATINAVINKKDESPIFKVNFDQESDATFIAKFDDNFGEDATMGFVANFSQCEAKPEESKESFTAAIPPADRYAVFREIMEQEQQSDSFEQKSTPDEADEDHDNMFNDSNAFSDEEDKSETYLESSSTTIDQHSQPIQLPKIIDTKITEAISHAKDRYAALRDIILVEDIFEKPVAPRPPSETLICSFIESTEDFSNTQEDLMENEKSKSIGGCDDESSPESIQNFDDEGAEKSDSGGGSGVFTNSKKFMHTLTVGAKDDLEIDELMNRAISNLSLDSRDHLSPNIAKSPSNVISISSKDNLVSTSPSNQQFKNKSSPLAIKSQFNDVSTSPIPIQKSPVQKSPLSKSPLSKSPAPQQLTVVGSIIEGNKLNTVSPLSDICGSSPDTPEPGLSKPTDTSHPTSTAESWAVFDKPTDAQPTKDIKQQRGTPQKLNLKSQLHLKAQRRPKEMLGDSPCSSEGKDEWKGETDYGNRRWTKGHTSSSSRDLSPWDDEAAADYKKQIPSVVGIDRQGYYMRHSRRMNSCDDDYEYEDEIAKRRDRKIKSGISRSRDNFEMEPPTWYPSVSHHIWSPPDEDGRSRSFERGSYDRTTYGPPVYDKRDHKIGPHGFYDRRSDRNFDKRKYYREYARPNYDFDTYPDSIENKDRKMVYHGDSFEKPKIRRDYENIYDEGFPRESSNRSYKARDYFYDRDRKSFDRESGDSYESASRRRRSFGSGDVYGSVESREEFRERYMGGSEKTRSLRKANKMRTNGNEYEPDSETDVQMRRGGPVETRSLQRFSQGPRIRKSSGSSPWDGEEPPPIGHIPKGWKRPASATESDRRLAERRVINQSPSGSDGEKDRRFRKKQRSRIKDNIALEQASPQRPSNVQSARYTTHRDNYDYINYDDYDPPIDEDKFERLNRRRHDMHLRMMENERRKKNDQCNYDDDVENIKYPNKKELCYNEKDRYGSLNKFDAFEDTKQSSTKPSRSDFDFEDYGETPRSNDSRNKFNFESEHGFESDFSSAPPTTASLTGPNSAGISLGKTFRFSNDFSDKEKHISTATITHTTVTLNASSGNLVGDFPTTAVPSSSSSIQKLRFDDKVTVSKFDNDQPSAFEDDFSKAEFDFEKEDQWNPEQPKKNNLRINSNKIRQDMIKKSESVNIFAKKVEDPFEDDEFFKSTSPASSDRLEINQIKSNCKSNSNSNTAGDQTISFQWDSNFAKFDENM